MSGRNLLPMTRTFVALWLGVALAIGIALSALAMGLGQTGTLGVTNFDSITLGEDLIVGDDVSVAGDATFSGGVVGVISNTMAGAAISLDPGGSSKIQATANYRPILTVGGTPTAAAFRINDSAATPMAVFRGGAGSSDINAAGGLNLNGPVAYATSVPLAGVASTAVAPVGRLQPVSMATAGTVPITIPPAGQVVCVYNTGSQTVTIADTGNQVLTTAAALGQYDAVCGISDGTRFIEISRADN